MSRLKRVVQQDEGFTLIEVIVSLGILAVLFGITTLALSSCALATDAEGTVNLAEYGIVQSAVDIYMADQQVSTIPSRGSPDEIEPGDPDAPFQDHLRDLPTKCRYSWSATGAIRQAFCYD